MAYKICYWVSAQFDITKCPMRERISAMTGGGDDPPVAGGVALNAVNECSIRNSVAVAFRTTHPLRDIKRRFATDFVGD
jgi:hypothetical protein